MKRAIPVIGTSLVLALVAAPAVASFVPPPGNGGKGGNGGAGGTGGAGSKQPPKKEQPKKEEPKKEDPKKPS
jgi:hypothetical protein